MTDVQIEALFHKYALHGMNITRNGEAELIPPGAMYEAQAFWKKCNWLTYEINRKTRRTTTRKIAVKVAVENMPRCFNILRLLNILRARL